MGSCFFKAEYDVLVEGPDFLKKCTNSIQPTIQSELKEWKANPGASKEITSGAFLTNKSSILLISTTTNTFMSATAAGASSYTSTDRYTVSDGKRVDFSDIFQESQYPALHEYYKKGVAKGHEDKSPEEIKCHLGIAGDFEGFKSVLQSPDVTDEGIILNYEAPRYTCACGLCPTEVSVVLDREFARKVLKPTFLYLLD